MESPTPSETEAAPSAAWSEHVGTESFREATRALLLGLVRHAEGRPVAELLPEALVDGWLDEDASPETIEAKLRAPFDAVWERVDRRLRREERTPRELLGKEASEAIIELAESAEPPDDAVRAIFRQGAIEELLATVLYDGIIGFIKKADVLGALIDRIPVIGGLRRRVMQGLQAEFERRAEGQVRSFLTGASQEAVERAIAFALSAENRKKFRAMRRRLVEHLLDRPVKELLLPPARGETLRERVFSAVRTRFGDREALRRLHRRAREEVGARSGADVRTELSLPDLTGRIADALAPAWLSFARTAEAERWAKENPLPR